MTPVPRAARLAVEHRDGGMCALCGTTWNLTIHHRQNRGMGGSSRPEVHSPANLLLCCAPCNNLLEADAELAREARVNGWKVSHPTDPASVPVWTRLGWVLLDDLGTATPLEEPA